VPCITADPAMAPNDGACALAGAVPKVFYLERGMRGLLVSLCPEPAQAFVHCGAEVPGKTGSKFGESGLLAPVQGVDRAAQVQEIAYHLIVLRIGALVDPLVGETAPDVLPERPQLELHDLSVLLDKVVDRAVAGAPLVLQVALPLDHAEAPLDGVLHLRNAAQVRKGHAAAGDIGKIFDPGEPLPDGLFLYAGSVLKAAFAFIAPFRREELPEFGLHRPHGGEEAETVSLDVGNGGLLADGGKRKNEEEKENEATRGSICFFHKNYLHSPSFMPVNNKNLISKTTLER